MKQADIKRAAEAITILDFLKPLVFGKTKEESVSRFRHHSLGSPELLLKPEQTTLVLRALYDYAANTLEELGVEP